MSISPKADAAEVSQQLKTIRASCRVVEALVAHMVKTQELPPPPKLDNPMFKIVYKSQRFKPLNNTARNLARLAGGQTLDSIDIEIIQDMGFKVIIDKTTEQKVKNYGKRPPNET